MGHNAIRISQDEARRLGLLDPALVPATGKTPTQPKSRKMASGTGRKSKTGSSRPAKSVVGQGQIPGHGKLELDAEDRVSGARFRFDLVPVPKERPRIMNHPGAERAFGYTPARTKHFTREVVRVVEEVMKGRAPIAGPVRLEMYFHMKIPVSWPKWKRQAAADGLIMPTGRPDMDNLEKALLDAFNGTLITDDAFVIERHAWKLYTDAPHILVRVAQTGAFGVTVARSAIELRRRIDADQKKDLS